MRLKMRALDVYEDGGGQKGMQGQYLGREDDDQQSYPSILLRLSSRTLLG